MKLDDFRFRLVGIVAEVKQLSICNPFGSVVEDIQADTSAFASFLDLRGDVLAVQIFDDCLVLSLFNSSVILPAAAEQTGQED